ncbi:MAG: peptidylprolyl isomerase [Coriobacteriia bacterium]|nr:peptidylprolyl isomerase [Coriobacteriia bacterium]
MARAAARHILVPSAEQANDIKAQIAAGADFAEMARQHSTCPSGARGGDLGEFSPGQMVKEFNDVCFNDEVGVVHGPVQTQFGFHLIEVTNRTD